MISSRLIDAKRKDIVKKICSKKETEAAKDLKRIHKRFIKNSMLLLNGQLETIQTEIEEINRDIGELNKLKEKKSKKNLKQINNEIKDLSDLIEKKNKRLNKLSKIDNEEKFTNKIRKKTKIIYKHSTCTFKIAMDIYDLMETDISKDVLSYATYLHDMIKVVDKSSAHSYKSAKIFIKMVENDDLSTFLTDKEIKQISKAIYYHNRREKIGGSKLSSKAAVIVKILHDSDKISKLLKKSTWSKDGKYLCPKEYNKKVDKIHKSIILEESEEVFYSYLNLLKQS